MTQLTDVPLIDAAIAWSRVKPLFHAAARAQAPGMTLFAGLMDGQGDNASDTAVLDIRDLTYRYPNRAEPILRHCTLQLVARDRVLLQGPSGSGKSTLASLAAGLRHPDSGLRLLHGVDHAALGDTGWRSRVVVAPQFHDNHVFCETFLFNLLMGRRWPPELEPPSPEGEGFPRRVG